MENTENIKEEYISPWNSAYPRPQMKRESFIPLNGEWEILVPREKYGSYKRKITLPYPPESKLSGITDDLKNAHTFIYFKKLELTRKEDKRLILHFGAADRLTRVHINSIQVGEHDGGYSPFSFDITELIENGENEIMVECHDGLDKSYPHGKQRKDRGGMWYTPVSGIWQSVWMEEVPREYIKKVKISAGLHEVRFDILGGAEHKKLRIPTPNGEIIKEFDGESITCHIGSAINWTPDEPYLYDYTLSAGDDTVKGYFAMREVRCEGNKILLNGKPVFLNALLDQGYYSDGIFTPKSPEKYKDDILLAKRMGFNALRKHIKIEPLIFYEYCDRLGMLVMQDAVNNSDYSFLYETALPTIGLKSIKPRRRSEREKELFISGMTEMAELLYAHPCVIYYTVFNEGWGQFECKSEKEDVYKLMTEISGGRIIDTASGWFKPHKSDVISEHIYFKRLKMSYSPESPTVLSEFGGYTLGVEGHRFSSKKYGYKHLGSIDELTNAIEALYLEQVIPEVKKGLSGAVYTQISDVEDELNGLITYDREVIKVHEDKIKCVMAELFKEFEAHNAINKH